LLTASQQRLTTCGTFHKDADNTALAYRMHDQADPLLPNDNLSTDIACSNTTFISIIATYHFFLLFSHVPKSDIANYCLLLDSFLWIKICRVIFSFTYFSAAFLLLQ